MKSDSEIVTNSVVGKNKALSLIVNLIADAISLTHSFKNIQFNYRSRSVNRLTDTVT